MNQTGSQKSEFTLKIYRIVRHRELATADALSISPYATALNAVGENPAECQVLWH